MNRLEILEEVYGETEWSESALMNLLRVMELTRQDEQTRQMENEFNPDWNVLEATQESLREYMAENQRLRGLLEQALEVIELARTSQNKLLPTNPPKIAWDYYGVDNKLIEAAAALQQAIDAAVDYKLKPSMDFNIKEEE